MEPIRPDDDELRAERPVGATKPVRPEGDGRQPPAEVAPGRARRKHSDAGRSRPGGSVLQWLLLLVVAGAASAGWYLQERRLQGIESQLEEADYWVRQSRLALARFEGDLSETGESLQERGSSLEEQLVSHGERLDTADSEIRKLWVVANERNKQRLNDHQARISSFSEQLAEAEKAVADLAATSRQERAGLAGDLAQLSERLDGSLKALEQTGQEREELLLSLSQKVEQFDQLVDNRLRRFEREQNLAQEGLEGRVSSLEAAASGAAASGDLKALRDELAQLRQTVEAVDASRAQVTSRLVRLSDEVNQLRTQVSGQ